MDKENIQRLRISLIEKAKQYNAMGKVIFTAKIYTVIGSFQLQIYFKIERINVLKSILQKIDQNHRSN